MKKSEVLKIGRSILAEPGVWVHTAGYLGAGTACMVTACLRKDRHTTVYGSEYRDHLEASHGAIDVLEAVHKELHPEEQDMVAWNDSDDSTLEEVLRTYDTAIERAEIEEKEGA